MQQLSVKLAANMLGLIPNFRQNVLYPKRPNKMDGMLAKISTEKFIIFISFLFFLYCVKYIAVAIPIGVATNKLKNST